MPRKPVSRIMSRMSVKGTRGNEFQRLAPRAHLRFLLAGRRAAARESAAPRMASAVRRFMTNIMTGVGRYGEGFGFVKRNLSGAQRRKNAAWRMGYGDRG